MNDRGASDTVMARLLSPQAARSADMQAAWDWLIAQSGSQPDPMTLDAPQLRALYDGTSLLWNADLPAVAGVERLSVPGPAGAPAIACDLIEPKGARPGCILYLHGGGFALGNLASHARLTRLLAAAAGMRVLVVDYRLAPEHPYPAPLDDGIAAWRWLVGQSTARAGLSGPLSVAGDSAGANLALSIALREIELGRPSPAAALLFYGCYVADTDTASHRRFGAGFGLTTVSMERFWDWYVPESGPDSHRQDYLVSPLRAGEGLMARLPPCFLNAAGLDPLLSDTLDLAARFDATGVPHELAMHEGVHHGFMQMSLRLPEAMRAIDKAGAFLRSRLP